MLYAILIAIVGIGSGIAYLADRRRAAHARRVGLIGRIQHGEAAQVLLQEQTPFARRARRARDAMDRRARKRSDLARRRDELSGHAWRGERWSLGFVVIVIAGTAVWMILFALQREMDINILVALGYLSPPVFGTVIALIFAVVGTIVCGLFGLHPLLPPWVKPTGRFGQITTALVLAALSVAFMAYLQKIAVYRSVDQFGTRASILNATLNQQIARHAPTLEIEVTRNALHDAVERLQTGKTLDRALTMTVPALEMALSAAPILATELLVVGYHALATNRADRRMHASHRAIRRAKEDFDGYAIGLLAEAGEPVGSLRQRMAELPQLDADPMLEPDQRRQGITAVPTAEHEIAPVV